VNSQYVVGLYAVKETEKNFLLLMEFVNGGTLTTFIEKRGNYVHEHEARTIIRQIVQGVIALHD